MTQFNQITKLWNLVPCPNRVEPQKPVSYLKAKSSTSESDYPHTLSLLSGSSKWLRILKDGIMDPAHVPYQGRYQNIDATCSLFDTSKLPFV